MVYICHTFFWQLLTAKSATPSASLLSQLLGRGGQRKQILDVRRSCPGHPGPDPGHPGLGEEVHEEVHEEGHGEVHGESHEEVHGRDFRAKSDLPNASPPALQAPQVHAAGP